MCSLPGVADVATHSKALVCAEELQVASARTEEIAADTNAFLMTNLHGRERKIVSRWYHRAGFGFVNRPMADTLTPLLLDFLEWIARKPRPYSQVMDAWRTSCPKLTVWEEANDHGFVEQTRVVGQEMLVQVTPFGR